MAYGLLSQPTAQMVQHRTAIAFQSNTKSLANCVPVADAAPLTSNWLELTVRFLIRDHATRVKGCHEPRRLGRSQMLPL
jgi:hypothetical protein